MRLSVPGLALGLTLACGNKVDHPAGLPDCDRSTMDCGGYRPPSAGDPGLPGTGGSGGSSSQPEGATFQGDVLVFTNDFFEEGIPYAKAAEISATGESGARVAAPYDGTSFELENVLKDATNWFMVEPEASSGMLPTITPIDTRVVKAEGISLGLASEAIVDGLFALVGSERSQERAQIVVRVVDEEGRSIAGVVGGLTAEIVAYREAGSWIIGDVETDDSGMIFFGNVPAEQALGLESIPLSGSVGVRVEALSRAGAITIVTAVASPP
ncbi:MAG TPA: hypothetical protein VJN18_16300 [Polyangiaceae bacterium]|nr:hypothetical protein [Polyangiaceae bacterium]